MVSIDAKDTRVKQYQPLSRILVAMVALVFYKSHSAQGAFTWNKLLPCPTFVVFASWCRQAPGVSCSVGGCRAVLLKWLKMPGLPGSATCRLSLSVFFPRPLRTVSAPPGVGSVRCLRLPLAAGGRDLFLLSPAASGVPTKTHHAGPWPCSTAAATANATMVWVFCWWFGRFASIVVPSRVAALKASARPLRCSWHEP